MVKKQIMHNQNNRTIAKHERQRISAGQIPEDCRGHVPKTELPKRTIAEIIDRFHKVKLNCENNYIPQMPKKPKLQLMNYLVQRNNETRWYKSEECVKCKSFTSYYRLQRLLEGKIYVQHRRDMMDSLNIKLDYYVKKYNTQMDQMIENELYSKLNDIARI